MAKLKEETEKITRHIYKWQLEELQARQDEQGVPQSATIRMALTEYFARHPRKGMQPALRFPQG